jgi:hypothetical protein
MKEVYIVYASIPSTLFDCKLHDFVNDESRYNLKNMCYTGLYAWTTKEDLLNQFMEFRKGAKSIYNIITRKFTKEEYHAFKKDNYYEELNYYKYFYDKDDNKHGSVNKFLLSIVCTREEYEKIYDNGYQYMFDHMSQILNVDYLIFKDEYKLALDYIGYCDMFNRVHDGLNYDGTYDDFYHDRNEMSAFNSGYGLSFYGNNFIDICESNLSVFINVFYEMIVGFDPNTEIKLLIYR